MTVHQRAHIVAVCRQAVYILLSQLKAGQWVGQRMRGAAVKHIQSKVAVRLQSRRPGDLYRAQVRAQGVFYACRFQYCQFLADFILYAKDARGSSTPALCASRVFAGVPKGRKIRRKGWCSGICAAFAKRAV